MNSSKNYIDWNLDANYPLQWMQESQPSRLEFQHKIFRVDRAMEGFPSRNLYKEELTSNIQKLDKSEQEDAKKSGCLNPKEGRSYILRKAVQNRANQMASGVDAYEYQVNDPYMIIEDDTEDLLAAKCSQDYVENKLEMMSPVFSRDLTNYGIAAVIVNYDQLRDKNVVERINPKNIWFDTMYSSTGRERFRGYSMMISWDRLKKIIEADKDEINTKLVVPDKSMFSKDGKINESVKIGKRKIRTLNDLDIYIEDINKLAGSPSLQAPQNEYWEYNQDLRSCYNLNWYHTFATDDKSRTNSGYNGQDVELTVMYDLDRKIEYKIINRRFVISANHNSFCRKIAFSIYDSINDETKIRVDDFNLDCPLKFQFEQWENKDKFQHPMSPVMTFLDAFDELCSWRAKRDHVAKILSILRIETNGADATSLKKTLNIMGVVLDDIQGDINSIRFDYDWTAIDSQIEYLEKTIVDGLSAYDQFDALQSMGDRASAAESGMAVGAIAQGLATHQNAIMQLYADIARQCIANRVAYSDRMEFPVSNLGGNNSITIQQMALDAIVTVKPKLAKKVQERTAAANALTLIGSLKDILTTEGQAYLIQQAMFGNVPRKMAATFVKDAGPSEQEIANAQLQAQNQAQMLQQNQQAYEQNPIQYEVDNVMQGNSPEDIDAIIGGLNQQENPGIRSDQGQSVGAGNLGMESGDMSNLAGMTPENAGYMANPNSFGEM